MSTDARSFVFGQVKVSNGAVATPFFLYAAGDTWQHSIHDGSEKGKLTVLFAGPGDRHVAIGYSAPRYHGRKCRSM